MYKYEDPSCYFGTRESLFKTNGNFSIHKEFKNSSTHKNDLSESSKEVVPPVK